MVLMRVLCNERNIEAEHHFVGGVLNNTQQTEVTSRQPV